MSESNENITHDTLFDGQLHCLQHTSGYRFSVDSVLLADFCRLGANKVILDLGTGSGIIGLILGFRYSSVCSVRIDGLEIQPRLARLARKNIEINSFQDRMRVFDGDLRRIHDFIQAESYDMVVCNPPYRKHGSGRVNPTAESAIARHEISATVKDVVKAASYAVKNRKSVFFVYPASRTTTLLHRMQWCNLEPKKIRPVYSYPGTSTAKLILVEAVKNGGEGLEILSPLYIYTQRNGSYSDEVERALMSSRVKG